MDTVLLGFIDQPIPDAAGVSWDTNKIGGTPVWMKKPLNSSPCCNVCSSLKTFIGQFYCPLSESAFHRTLYIFVCCRCHILGQKGSWTVLRSLCVAEESSLKHSSTEVSCRPSVSDEWGSDADEWDEVVPDNSICCTDDVKPSDRAASASGLIGSGHSVLPAETNIRKIGALSSADVVSVVSNRPSYMSSSDEPIQLLQSLTIGGDVSTQNGIFTNVPQYTVSGAKIESSNESSESISYAAGELVPYYIYVIDEPSSATDLSHHVEDLLAGYTRQEGRSFDAELEFGKCMSGGSEKYEKVNVRHRDYAFYKFTRKIGDNPDQIVRYCRNSQPLCAGAEAHGMVIPQCGCGAKRTFELQLMPALVYVLRRPEQSEPAVEFLSVHVYTCSENCWRQDAEFVEEFAMAEYDQDERLVDEAASRIAAAGTSNTVLHLSSPQSAGD